MDRFLNSLKAQAASLDHSQGHARFAVVASCDPGTQTVRVHYQPEEVLSGWLPVLSMWTGAGWGLCAPPSPGDQVLVIPQDGDSEHGVVVGRAYSTVNQPLPAPSGEFWLVHSSGCFIKLANTGTVLVNGPVSIQSTVSIQGDLDVSGDVSDRHGSLSGLRGHYNGHNHVDSRGGQTSVASPQD